MSKNIQIDLMFFLDMAKYIKCQEDIPAEELEAFKQSLYSRIDNKLTKLIAHMYYTDYRQEPDPTKRDEALKKYLNEIYGMD